MSSFAALPFPPWSFEPQQTRALNERNVFAVYAGVPPALPTAPSGAPTDVQLFIVSRRAGSLDGVCLVSSTLSPTPVPQFLRASAMRVATPRVCVALAVANAELRSFGSLRVPALSPSTAVPVSLSDDATAPATPDVDFDLLCLCCVLPANPPLPCP